MPICIFGYLRKRNIMPFLYTVIYVIVLGAVSHFVGESLPRKILKPDSFPFAIFNFEKSGELYRKLRVKKWKDALPDMSKIMKDMIPKKVKFGASSADVTALVYETCIAELTHLFLCIFGLFIPLFWLENSIFAGTILSLIYILCNIPFIIIQRYNRPNLVRLAERLSQREKRLSNENSDTVM